MGINIEHQTSIFEHPTRPRRTVVRRSVFDVRCSMFVFAAILFATPLLFGQASTNALPALAPAYGVIPPTFWEQEGTTVLVGGVTLIALAVLILWKLFQPKPVVILPPEILALEALAKLLRQPEDEKLLSNVSQILRRYVIAAFELPAAELTTTEFCAALAASKNIGAELAGAISSFLRECDERKFSPASSAAPFNAASRALKLVDLAEKRRGLVGRASPRAGAESSGSSVASSHQTPALK